MEYKFNFFFQLIYGIMAFAVAMVIIYLFDKRLDWIACGIIGISEFVIAGFYTKCGKCKPPQNK
ncbi:MAG: hypothetical protein WAU65_03155 [Candidatus Nanoarchaeia archaeon]